MPRIIRCSKSTRATPSGDPITRTESPHRALVMTWSADESLPADGSGKAPASVVRQGRRDRGNLNCAVRTGKSERRYARHSRRHPPANNHRPAADPQRSVPRRPVALCDCPRRPPRDRQQDPDSRSRRTPGENRRKIEQPGKGRCSRSLAEASSCSSAAGSSYREVANTSHYSVRLMVPNRAGDIAEGAPWRFVAQWDSDGCAMWDALRHGSSGHPLSPHYEDQTAAHDQGQVVEVKPGFGERPQTRPAPPPASRGRKA